MIKENAQLLKINLENKRMIYSKMRTIIYEALYELYYLILQDPIENILFEIITFLFSYLQILMFVFNETVSN